jgi:hypothetical protein
MSRDKSAIFIANGTTTAAVHGKKSCEHSCQATVDRVSGFIVNSDLIKPTGVSARTGESFRSRRESSQSRINPLSKQEES